MPVDSIGSPALWVGFTVFVLAMLALDLGAFHLGSGVESSRVSTLESKQRKYLG